MRSRCALALVVSLVACKSGASPTSPSGAGGASSSSAMTSSTVAGTASSSTGAGGSGGSQPIPLPTGRFRIGMWCGPPLSELTQARFDEIAGAGFTTVSNACDGATYEPGYDLKMLSLAQGAGLDAIVSDARLASALAGVNVAQNLDGVVADYAKQPALAGYFLGDEPSAPAFANLASLVSQLSQRDAAHFAYVNLLPDYASNAQLGTSSYDDYIGQFLSVVKPQVVSYDYYPFLTGGGEASTFFADMAVVRAHAVATATPFWQFTQSISFTGHRDTNLAEKLWVGMQTLAYGGQGISYFTYWTPPQTAESFGSAIIDANGNETAQYQEVKTINARLRAFGRYLVAATSTGVFQNGPLPAGTAPRVPGSIVYVPSAAPITVGLFSVGKDAYAFLVNRRYDSATESDVYFPSGAMAPELLDVTSGAFGPMTILKTDANGQRAHVVLAPGDGALVHLTGPVAPGPPGAEAYVGTVRADAGTLDVVDSSFGTASLRGAGWNDCPQGYEFAGRDFESNGFWLCVRKDLTARTFYVGNVVADAGTLFSVANGTATALGPGGWDSCPAGTELGKRFESNGYWLCMQ